MQSPRTLAAVFCTTGTGIPPDLQRDISELGGGSDVRWPLLGVKRNGEAADLQMQTIAAPMYSRPRQGQSALLDRRWGNFRLHRSALVQGLVV